MEDTKMYVVDDNGNEFEMEIVFTFESEDYGRKYVVYRDPKDSEDELYASIYDEEGNIFEIEDDEELSMLEEVLGAFLEDEED